MRPSAGPLLTDQTRRLLTAITADPAAPLRLAIVAPGGYGKSTLLREIANAYQDAGVDTVTGEPASGAVTLVDNAHLLTGAQLARLRDSHCARMVVACRPWPWPAELTDLMLVLDRSQLGPWDVISVKRLLGEGAEAVHGLTGGVPRWVARVARDGEAAARSLRFDLESLDRDVLRYLVAVHAGAGLRIDLLGDLLGRDSDGVAEVMRAARATGFLSQDGTLLPLCARAVAEFVPAELYLGVLQRLAELRLDGTEPILPFARFLLGSGATGPTVATVLDMAAREVVGDDPAAAAELFGAAVSAGRPLRSVVADWARAAALSGDLDTALRLADQAVGAGDASAARVAAAALAHRGQWARSAELYGWAGDKALASIASIAVGDLTATSVTHADGPPTLLDGAAALMAEGVRLSVSGSQVTALSLLVRSSALLEPAGRDALLPDSPAALAALVALHCGATGVAESVLDSAGSMGGAVMRTRHTLLRAWINMCNGRLEEAGELVDGLGAHEPRDRLFLVALEIGLARRSGDTPALRRAWQQVGECLVRHPVDLFTILPLAEFVVASARLRDTASLGTAPGDALAILHRLGDPPLWATPLHWAGVHAALIAENLDAARGHIAVLAANHTSYGSALTQAATCWLDVTTARVDPDQVQAATGALLEAGLWWDSARLASEAAIRTSDRKAMVSLLDRARGLQARQHQTRRRPVRQPPASDLPCPLSEREQEVADLILQGMTYKQVGDKLFISAKTVEHHVARIRQRLGATNRSEMLTQLRAIALHPAPELPRRS
ncbi:helix-turn-helix transcriptional regulator [Actinocrispum wychmicini]|uniref:Regulatory LuxR family protein n=1 Tax=Actinocrispum wychmicini TaxID=1213861 RepID=A0A4R2INE9_9PSEU|nr:LuxR C-terminal-related transcriptional regulator [Actinocrispum wychmicini]TCO44215.1 regulatory LuxR family protein [Actinocrispum wychmicini]